MCDVIYDNHERDNAKLFKYFMLPYTTFKSTAFENKWLEIICARKLKYAYFEHLKNSDVTSEELEAFKQKILSDNEGRKYFSLKTFERFDELAKEARKIKKEESVYVIMKSKTDEGSHEYEVLKRKIANVNEKSKNIYYDLAFYEKI